VDVVLAVRSPRGGGVRVLVAHGTVVVLYSDEAASVLIGPGSGNGVCLAGGVARICASECGQYVAVFDCARRMFLFDGYRFVGATDVHIIRVDKHAAVYVGVAGGGAAAGAGAGAAAGAGGNVTVVVSTRERIVLVRPTAAEPVCGFTIEADVTCAAAYDKAMFMYGCRTGMICVSDFLTQDNSGTRTSSCDVVCKFGAAITCLAPCKVSDTTRVVVGLADGRVGVVCSDSVAKGWVTATGACTPVTALSVFADARIFAAVTRDFVYVGSLVHAGVCLQRLPHSPSNTPLSVVVYAHSDLHVRLATVDARAHLQIWNVDAAVRAACLSRPTTE
jgi:hypothetical protein